MNLGKLLAAGKSIIGGSREISYRNSDRSYLPKFVSPKNPFVPPPARTEPAPVVAATPVKSRMASDGDQDPKIARFCPGPSSKAELGQKIESPCNLARRAAGNAGKSAASRAGRTFAGQVKVVHNDLSDADVEIVPIKSRTLPGAAEPILPPAQAENPGSRLSERLLE